MIAETVQERSWRKARRRGVSPIDAMVLLVAISVVLGAVLYVLVAGLAHGPGATPIGSAFSAGHPTGGSCTAGSSQAIGALPVAGGCKAGDFVYTLTVESSSVAFGDIRFELKTSSGLIYSTGSVSSSFAVIDTASHVAAISVTGSTMAMGSAWQAYGLTTTSPTYSGSTPLTSLHTIVIDVGSAAPTTGQGLKLVALGAGSYSGSTSPVDLP
jgi:flagellin-like protein